jgi:hypothetical protein
VQRGTCEGDECLEVLFEFFVSCGETAEVLEFGEASLDAVAFSVEFFVVGSLLPAVGFGGHDRDRSHSLDVIEDGLTVVALIGQYPLGLPFSEQLDGLGAVVDLASGDDKIYRQPQFVGQQVDLRCQTSSGTPQSLVRALFLRPVAACWWARTMVESIIR